jgi:hypothetical protein
MSSDIISKILDRIGQPDLVRLLATELSGTELNSILLEVFNERTANTSPPDLLKLYQLNRFVKPADLPVLELKQTELDLLTIFARHHFDPIELSPVAILGACSAVAPANQKKVLSALRGTEVLADATNSIALHISDLKKRKVLALPASEKIRFSTIQRHVRTQTIAGKGFSPHFKIGCLVTSGLDCGAFSFEKEALSEHLQLMKVLFTGHYRVKELSFRLLCRNGYPDSHDLATKIRDFLLIQHPGTPIYIVQDPVHQTDYYKGVQYKVDVKVNNKSYEIGDGGFVDWTQQLLQNKKERLLITGFGFDFMYRILKGMV